MPVATTANINVVKILMGPPLPVHGGADCFRADVVGGNVPQRLRSPRGRAK